MGAMHKIIVYTLIITALSGVSTSRCYCAEPEKAAAAYDAKGKRDPFVPLIGQERSSGADLASVVSVDDLKLEGIAAGAKGRQVAIINGQMVKESDKFGAIVIKNITPRSVRLSIEGKDYTLDLQEPEKENAGGKE
jgi:hypothetical protein